MHSADEPKGRETTSDRPPRNPVSVALLAAVASMPLVIAAGFMTDRPAEVVAAAVPGDISVLALRGGLDVQFDRRPSPPMRAGY